MRTGVVSKVAVLLLVMWSVSLSASGRMRMVQTNGTPPAQTQPVQAGRTRPPSGPGFYIERVEGANVMFSVLLSDGTRTVTGTFTQKQVEVFEAVLLAAKEFAQTDEAVGKKSPIITRLMDQHEWSLFVDVSKLGDASRFYVSLITINGKLTAEAGEIIRGSKKESSALLLKILSRVQEAKASSRMQ